MTNTTKHTPLPRIKVARVFVENGPEQYHIHRARTGDQWGKDSLAVCDSEETAQAIVQACNSHEAMLEGLKYLAHLVGEENVPGDILATIAQAEGR